MPRASEATQNSSTRSGTVRRAGDRGWCRRAYGRGQSGQGALGSAFLGSAFLSSAFFASSPFRGSSAILASTAILCTIPSSCGPAFQPDRPIGYAPVDLAEQVAERYGPVAWHDGQSMMRVAAGALGFLILIQSGERPDR